MHSSFVKMEGEQQTRHRTTGLSHHPWNAEEDAFLAFMVAVGLTVEGIKAKYKELFNVDLRENQITGRIAEIKKRIPSLPFLERVSSLSSTLMF